MEELQSFTGILHVRNCINAFWKGIKLSTEGKEAPQLPYPCSQTKLATIRAADLARSSLLPSAETAASAPLRDVHAAKGQTLISTLKGHTQAVKCDTQVVDIVTIRDYEQRLQTEGLIKSAASAYR
jgi:hypothetical protein